MISWPDGATTSLTASTTKPTVRFGVRASKKLVAGAWLPCWEAEAPANVHDRNHPPLSVDHAQHDIWGVRERRDFYHVHDSLHCRKWQGVALRIERKDHKLTRLMPLVTR